MMPPTDSGHDIGLPTTERLALLLVQIAFGLVFAALAVRLMYGVDLGDEAYYVAFITEWLKTDMARTSFQTIHQTAALIPYLPSRLFVALSGSTDGIVLFLRVVFLAFSTVAALLWWHFIKGIASPVVAGLSAIIILSFVPFGLPAPSYNTIGMQALTAAIACLGCAEMAQSSRTRKAWHLASSAAWAIGVVAYPTLGAVAAALIVVLLASGNRLVVQGRLYAVTIGIAVAVGVGAATALLSPAKMIGSIRYLNLINDVSGFDVKIAKTVTLFAAHPISAGLFAAAAALGLARLFLRPVVFAVLLALLIAATFTQDAALFVQSHDVVFVMALAGIGLLKDLAAPAGSPRRLVAIGYAISLSAALTTSTTALNGLFNFCVGGLPAAALAVTMIANDRRFPVRVVAATVAITALVAIMTTSLLHFYGEPYGAGGLQRLRVHSGPHKGLLVLLQDDVLIREVQEQITGTIGDSTLAVFAFVKSGILLETKARLSMLLIFPLPSHVSRRGLAFTRDYYAQLSNRPYYVIVFADGGQPVNPMGSDFDTWYRPIRRIDTPVGPLSLFQRR